MSEFKSDFSNTSEELLSFDIEDTSEVGVLLARVEKAIFDCSVEIKKVRCHDSPPSTSELNGIKLPKLDVPTFDGNILN